ncbi:MAG: penicillin-binding protein 2 [Gammaproteobacteria bacterium]|nr:penicillin-binding protein 2 [Gammaproteobacteria bacterium]MYF39077.1 penicillin-binding protein 2 [Gammaproteobacteria bacterium]
MSAFRYRLLFVGFSIVVLILLFRMFSLAYFDREFLQARGSAIAERTIDVPTNRGIIYDRNGEPLALSIPVYSFWTDPGFDTISDEDIPALAQALDVSEERLRTVLYNGRNTRFVYLKRRASREIADAVEALKVKGVRFEIEYRRYYPTAEVASHIVGIANSDGIGIEGLEAAHEKQLRGSPGKRRILRGRDGRRLRDIELAEPPVFGQDVTTTVDLGLQYLAYRHLRTAVEENDALSASAVVVEVSSGQILAMANYPTFNPNDSSDRVPARMRNRVIKDAYEPGSTVKPFSAIAAMESGKFQPDTEVSTSPGSFHVGDKLIEDPRDYGTLTLKMVLVKSSQVGIAKIALDLEHHAIYDVLSRVGFNEVPFCGLPNETPGILRADDLEREIGRATFAFGYGMTVSPLQLAKAYLTIATGGKRRAVTIVKDPTRRLPRDVQVLDPEQVASVMDMLRSVTAWPGTAPKAAIDGFSVAGKTGTVRKVKDGEYDENLHIAWFVGITPVEDPRFVTVVVVNEPKGETVSGGGVAAPIFARLTSHALQLIPPDYVAQGR